MGPERLFVLLSVCVTFVSNTLQKAGQVQLFHSLEELIFQQAAARATTKITSGFQAPAAARATSDATKQRGRQWIWGESWTETTCPSESFCI